MWINTDESQVYHWAKNKMQNILMVWDQLYDLLKHGGMN